MEANWLPSDEVKERQNSMTVERQASTRGSAPGGSENGCQDPELRARIFSWMDRAEAEGALRNIKGSGQSCDSGHTSSDANRESSWVSSSGRTPSGWEGDPPSSPRRGSRQEGASCDEPSRPSLDRHRPSLDLIRTLSSPEVVPSQLAASVPRLSRIAVSDWASEQWFIPHKDLSVDTTCEYQKISSSEVGCTWKGSLNPRVVEEDGVERTRMQPVAVKQVFMDEYSKLHGLDLRALMSAIYDLRHPCINVVIGFSSWRNGDMYVVSPLAGEGSLEDHILQSWAQRSAVQRLGLQKTSPSSSKKLSILHDVLSAVEYLNAVSMVHGGIRPSNILLSDGSSRARLCDVCFNSGLDRETMTHKIMANTFKNGFGEVFDFDSSISTSISTAPTNYDSRKAENVAELYDVGLIAWQLGMWKLISDTASLKAKLVMEGGGVAKAFAPMSEVALKPRIKNRSIAAVFVACCGVGGLTSVTKVLHHLNKLAPQRRPSDADGLVTDFGSDGMSHSGADTARTEHSSISRNYTRNRFQSICSTTASSISGAIHAGNDKQVSECGDLSPVSALLEASRRSPHNVSPFEAVEKGSVSPSAKLWRKITGRPPMMGMASSRSSSETMRSEKDQVALAAALIGGVTKTGALPGSSPPDLMASSLYVPDPGNGFLLRDRRTLQNFLPKDAAVSISPHGSSLEDNSWGSRSSGRPTQHLPIAEHAQVPPFTGKAQGQLDATTEIGEEYLEQSEQLANDRRAKPSEEAMRVAFQPSKLERISSEEDCMGWSR